MTRVDVPMSQNQTNPYDVDEHIAELYDRMEADNDDVEFIRQLIGPRRPIRILEPFCGTGRILIPLVLDGHRGFGLDSARGMLSRARSKVRQLPARMQPRIQLRCMDVIGEEWPGGFDLVILGNNCFYELATAEEQERCIYLAAVALHSGGAVYIDNDHMEGDLDPSWQETDPALAFPSGLCADGAYLESTMQTVWFDAPKRLARLRRSTRVVFPGGYAIEREYLQQKHPVSAQEVQTWLLSHGFTIEGTFGDHHGCPFEEASTRAIFWARKR
jgi:SAM-dependent methyltransferase